MYKSFTLILQISDSSFYIEIIELIMQKKIFISLTILQYENERKDL